MVSEGGIYMYKLINGAYSKWNTLRVTIYERDRTIRPP